LVPLTAVDLRSAAEAEAFPLLGHSEGRRLQVALGAQFKAVGIEHLHGAACELLLRTDPPDQHLQRGFLLLLQASARQLGKLLKKAIESLARSSVLRDGQEDLLQTVWVKVIERLFRLLGDDCRDFGGRSTQVELIGAISRAVALPGGDGASGAESRRSILLWRCGRDFASLTR
jgi:hypothetical protein